MDCKELFIDKDDVLLIRKELVRILEDLNEAVILNQLHYWVKVNEKVKKNLYDDRCWVFNTYQTWKETDFDFWSTDTIRRALTRLENKGIVLTANYNKSKIDKTKWYTIDYDKLQKLVDKYAERQLMKNEKADCTHDIANCGFDMADCTDGDGNMHKAIPENTTENTDIDINSKAHSFFNKKVTDRNKILNPEEVNQEELKRRIVSVIDELAEEVFTDDQAENIKACMIYFVDEYSRIFERRHPLLSEDTINEIAATITDRIYVEYERFTTYFQPLVSDEEDDNSYEEIIDIYFKTEFKQDINYSMVHFSQENVLTKIMGRAREKTWYRNE